MTKFDLAAVRYIAVLAIRRKGKRRGNPEKGHGCVPASRQATASGTQPG